MPIQLLRPEVSSKIAAGEVIERPASAVKELVENALDAGASRIRIEIRGGGIEYIRITDDGSGIPADQVELAFQRFATSKLEMAEDLDSVSTLGFRGEALPSIASVARVELRTRTTEPAGQGTSIEIDNGEIVSLGPAGAPYGTTITVRHLFRNLPARRRFLSSTNAEQTRIHRVVAHYAMAYPEVAFELSPERGRSFASPGSGDLRDAVSAVHGRQVAESMLEITQEGSEDVGTSVSGLIGPPSLDRANRSYISLFANRRWVRNRSLSYAIEQAYHGFMAERRYPVAVVSVSVPFREVDVNAHPAKAEIRFRRENSVFGVVQRAVRRTLAEHAPIPEISHRAVTQPAQHGGHGTPYRGMGQTQTPNPSAFWPTAPFTSTESQRAMLPTGDAIERYHSFIDPPDDLETVPTPPRPTPGDALPILRVLGQVQNTYVVAEGPDGMYLIDQHAAHERVMFERVMARAAEGSPDVQSLLEPMVVELDDAGFEIVTTRPEVISGMGFVLEPFGGTSVVVRAVPALLMDTAHESALTDVLDLMEEGGGFETWEERAAYSVACHGAIRAGKVMTHEEMQELVRQLEACAQPNTCPHGRPTMIHMSSGQLEREFGRT